MLAIHKLDAEQKIVPTELFKDLMKHKAFTLIGYALENSLINSYEYETFFHNFVGNKVNVLYTNGFKLTFHNLFLVTEIPNNVEVWEISCQAHFAMTVFCIAKDFNKAAAIKFIQIYCVYDAFLEQIFAECYNAGKRYYDSQMIENTTLTFYHEHNL